MTMFTTFICTLKENPRSCSGKMYYNIVWPLMILCKHIHVKCDILFSMQDWFHASGFNLSFVFGIEFGCAYKKTCKFHSKKTIIKILYGIDCLLRQQYIDFLLTIRRGRQIIKTTVVKRFSILQYFISSKGLQ